MKLDYAGGEVLVSDELCHALLSFSAEIAKTGGSDDLRIPVITVDGIQGFAEIVVGPASQLLATPTDAAQVDLEDSDVVADIVTRSAALKPSRVLPVSDADQMSNFDDPLG